MSQNARVSHSPAPSPAGEGQRPTTSGSSTESVERILQDGLWQHGRFYGSWKPGKYLCPIDKEELNRLDIFHKFFLVVRNGATYTHPLPTHRPPKVLDLGTGTGIWAINVAEEYAKDAQVMAVDLNQIQPLLIPPTMTTQQFDIEEVSWAPLLKDCDLIHLRMLLGSIHDDLWPATYRKIFETLKPGEGHMEHVEIDWVPQWEGSDVPSSSAIGLWAETFLRGMDGFDRCARVRPSHTRRMLENAGFVDITEETLRCYLNPWSEERHERECARWFNLGFTLGLEAMSLKPMIEQLGMTVAEVKDMCGQAIKESCKLRHHAYCTMYIWTAKRPPNKPQ